MQVLVNSDQHLHFYLKPTGFEPSRQVEHSEIPLVYGGIRILLPCNGISYQIFKGFKEFNGGDSFINGL
jgi:hypothetical protein